MIRYAAYTLLAVGLASQTLAEPVREPYQPNLARMSTRNILGLHRRDVAGYAPMEQLCGDGDTCAEACGNGFSQCASKDKLTHCYNRAKKQTCCPGGTGDACDNGYFCSADDAGKTWCCPDGLSLKECAQKYNIPGPLTSEAPPTSTTSAVTTTTTTKPTTTKSTVASDTSKTSASSASSTPTSTRKSATTSAKSNKPESTESAESTATSKVVHHEPTTTATTFSSSITTLLIDVSSALVATEGAATPTTDLDSAPTSTPSTTPVSSPTSSIGTSGGGSHGPANGLVFLIAGALAALV